MLKSLPALLLLALAAPASAGALYRCVGADGVPSYGNRKEAGARCEVVGNYTPRRLARVKPDAAAISMTAVWPSPSSPKKPATGCPKGPVTVTGTIRPDVASTSARTVPSPPSAMGSFT